MPGAYAVRRPVVNAYLVRQRDRRVRRELAWVVAAMLALAASMLAYTWLQLETLRVGYRIAALETRAHKLEQVERQLRLESAYLAQPRRLEERAAAELGLVEPSVDQVVFLEEWR